MFGKIKKLVGKTKELNGDTLDIIFKMIEEDRVTSLQMIRNLSQGHTEDMIMMSKRLNEVQGQNVDFWIDDLKKRVANLEKQNNDIRK